MKKLTAGAVLLAVAIMGTKAEAAQAYQAEYGYTGNGYRARMGTLASTGQSGSFAAVGPSPINVELAGTWTGSCALERKLPGEASFKGITIAGSPWAVYTTNVSEQAWAEGEAGSLFRLNCTITSGTVSWRLSQ